MDIEKQQREDSCDTVTVTKVKVIEKYLFFLGFLCPLAWFIGSSSCRTRNEEHIDQLSFIWKKRCRIAATLSLTIMIVIAAVVMAVNPKLFGLNSSVGAQTSSASNSAIRPGVPITGENDWGNTVAGLSVNDN